MNLEEVPMTELLQEICRRNETVIMATMREATTTRVGTFMHCEGNYMTALALAARLGAFIERKMVEIESHDPDQ